MPPMMPSVFIAFLPVGDVRPPLFCVWEGGGWSRLPPRSVLNGAHRAPGPPHPCKVLGFHPKPHKFFEKNLTKNFYVSPPGFCGGTRPCGTQEGGSSCAATRRELPGVQPPRTCASGSMSTSGSELPKARIVPHGHVLNLAAPCFQSSAYTFQNSGTGSSCSAPTASRSGPPRSSRSGTPCPPLSGPWPRPSRSRF